MRRLRQIPVLLFLLVFMAGMLPASSIYAKTGGRVHAKLHKGRVATIPQTKGYDCFANFSICEYLGLTFQEYCKSTFVASCENIIPISDQIGFSNFSDLPSEYEIWDTRTINPYDVSLVDMKDTITIDVSNYAAPSKKHVTSNFGFRKWKYHYGIDLKVHRGDTVRCAFDGVVRITRYQRRGYGYFMVVRHNNGLETLYGHLARFIAAEGDSLKAGDPIGLGGSTGKSTGYHLHLEMRYLGNPINPNDIIDFKSHTVHNKVLVLTAQNFAYKKEIDKIRYWTVKKGDTLSHISLKTGVSVPRLCALNGIKRDTVLRIGRRIRYT